MKLIVQPGAGLDAVVKAVEHAKKSVEIAIFRCDSKELEKALIDAAGRGVFVHALVAYTNAGGEKNLRALESRLLAAGVTVARTADDMVRYHNKYMIVDRTDLHVYTFNYTGLDTERSRNFGITTSNRKLVAEAIRLFESDTKRQPYESESSNLIVSPVNARPALTDLIQSARKEICIYDPKLSDPAMIRLLEERAKAGVAIRVLGSVTRKTQHIEACELKELRAHARCMVTDRECAFAGSQSLRALELDARRELGIITRDSNVVEGILKTFEKDWAEAQAGRGIADEEFAAAEKVAKKAAKAVAKSLPPVAPLVEEIVKEVAGPNREITIDPEEVGNAVKESIRQAIRDLVEEAVAGTRGNNAA